MIRKLLPHILLILAEMFIVLNILDSYNPAMGFLTSSLSKGLMMILCVIAVLGAVSMMIKNRKRE